MNISTKDTTEIFKFGTKAETLLALKTKLKTASISELFYFDVQRWRAKRDNVIQAIEERFSQDRYVVVRSSSQSEDQANQSMAGAFASFLNIECADTKKLGECIDQVVASFSASIGDQVLIQPMLKSIAVSGVIMTYHLEDGAPYYVINYDDLSGRTDSITGGTGVHKTVLIHRFCEDHYIDSPRVRKMLALAREVEEITKHSALDIEFGITCDGRVHCLQVRPISVTTQWNEKIAQRVNDVLPKIERQVQEFSYRRKGILGEKSILATMPDWNPAEMIGTHPRPLAASLYQTLITSKIWHEARAEMGYRVLENQELMVFIQGRPFIDVRNSFNSLLPAQLHPAIGEKLVNDWIARLEKFPELHDKIEFDVAITCLDFNFNQTIKDRFQDRLVPEETNEFRGGLKYVTKKALDLSGDGTLPKALKLIDRLCELHAQYDTYLQQSNQSVEFVKNVIDDCQLCGTKPFAVIARHAFIVESLLRSAVDREAISESRLKEFKRSIHTITAKFMQDMYRVQKGAMTQHAFMKEYGHLRPGTYDITSQTYAQRKDLFSGEHDLLEESTCIFELDAKEQRRINVLLAQNGFDHINAHQLFEYARMAIKGREYAKFVFTKSISILLDQIKLWGKPHGLNADDLSFLSIDDISLALDGEDQNIESLIQIIHRNRKAYQLAQDIKLSYIIRGQKDLYVVPLHRSEPNFIGAYRVEGKIVIVDAECSAEIELEDKIVCIQHADPGFDWIFTKGVKALITQYGGANSHMAIRCAEFGLPAAIGCGEELFIRLTKARRVELDGRAKQIKPLYG